MRLVKDVLNDIDQFNPVNGNWLRLEELFDELWKSGQPRKEIESALSVFEKFPEEDGSGVFWTLLHRIETLDYEQKLYDSLKSRPSMMTLIMLSRIEKSGTDTIAGNPINELKNLIKSNPETSPVLLDILM